MTAPDISPDGSRLTVHIPLTIRRRGGRKVVVAPQGECPQPTRRRIDSTLVKAIARAYRWQRMLEEGAYASLRDLAAAEQISPTYVSRLLRLTLLPPELVEAVLDGRLQGKPSEQWVSQQLSGGWNLHHPCSSAQGYAAQNSQVSHPLPRSKGFSPPD